MTDSYIPKVNAAKELAEISKDFTNPRELIRETIANSIDASASRIAIEALKDDSSGEDELVIRVADDGVGMAREELEGFFDLGFSNKRHQESAIGHKGHGTKITYNSATLTVFTKSIAGGPTRRATLANARRALNLAVRHVFYEADQTKCKVIYEIEPHAVIEETERQLDRSRNAISHVGFSEEWARTHGRVVFHDKT